MTKKTSPAAKLLIAIVVVIVLALAGAIWLNMNQDTAMRLAFVPGHPFAEEQEEPRLDYTDDAAWFALPGQDSFAVTRPKGVDAPDALPAVDVFFVHPTTYIMRGNWNAPLDDETANNRSRQFVLKHQASAFSAAGHIYAPRYRQAAFGAFFDDGMDGVLALQRAYTDVVVAFENFLARRNPDHGIILAAHSQGSLHSLRLLKDYFDGTALTDKLVAAYIIGWPVSVEGDIGAVDGVATCENATQTNCALSFQSFSKDGTPDGLLGNFAATPGLNGAPRAGTRMVCTNPLVWSLGGTADRTQNIGAARLISGETPLEAPIPTFTGAACGGDGILYLSNTPTSDDWTQFKMAGENFHAYDYNLFYLNIRDNARQRAEAWQAQQATSE